jgi:hypothetical protein
MKALIIAIVIGIAAIAAADAFGFTFARAAAQPGVSFSIDRSELHCDGDSTRVSVHAVGPDGAVMAGADVRFFVTGSVSVGRGQVASGDVAGTTDRRGNFTARVTPAAGTHIRWDMFVKVGDAISFPQAGACDFSTDRTYVLGGHVFRDRDGDGVQGSRERDAARVKMTISTGYSFGSLVPPHSQRTGRDGSFEWAGLSQDPVPGRSPWRVCLVDTGLAFTSMNGAPMTPDACVSVELAPGVNSLALGVQPTR